MHILSTIDKAIKLARKPREPEFCDCQYLVDKLVLIFKNYKESEINEAVEIAKEQIAIRDEHDKHQLTSADWLGWYDTHGWW